MRQLIFLKDENIFEIDCFVTIETEIFTFVQLLTKFADMLKFLASQFIKLKNNKENFALVLVALIIVFLIVFIVKVFTSISPDYLKFDPDTYGTVSDWVIVFATIVTAVFVYKTLASQQKVQEDQEKINKLTAYDIRSKYKAEFELENPQIRPFTLFDSEFWIFYIRDNDALSIELVCNVNHIVDSHEASTKNEKGLFKSNISMLRAGGSFRIALKDQNVQGRIQNLLSTGAKDEFVPILSFELNYSDNFGFQYSKRFQIEFNGFTNTLNIISSNTQYL